MATLTRVPAIPTGVPRVPTGVPRVPTGVPTISAAPARTTSSDPIERLRLQPAAIVGLALATAAVVALVVVGLAFLFAKYIPMQKKREVGSPNIGLLGAPGPVGQGPGGASPYESMVISDPVLNRPGMSRQSTVMTRSGTGISSPMSREQLEEMVRNRNAQEASQPAPARTGYYQDYTPPGASSVSSGDRIGSGSSRQPAYYQDYTPSGAPGASPSVGSGRSRPAYYQDYTPAGTSAGTSAAVTSTGGGGGGRDYFQAQPGGSGLGVYYPDKVANENPGGAYIIDRTGSIGSGSGAGKYVGGRYVGGRPYSTRLPGY
jgi:hypothetical protein